MDDFMPPLVAPRPTAPRLATFGDIDMPAGFMPLRLLLQPGGLIIDLNKPDMLVGRHSEADVRLSLPDISRRHCRFVFADGSWRVFDLNSLNGVFVNGERLHESAVFHGDRIGIASLMFDVDLEPHATRQAERRVTDLAEPEMRKAS